MLLEEYDGIIAAAARGGGGSPHYPPSWSNRLGSVLTPVSIPGVYTADRPFYWNGIDVGGRMTVIRLQSSSSSYSSDDDDDDDDDEGGRRGDDLVVHSPVFLDPPLVEALSKLGNVAHVISPNYEHVKYAKIWADYYPDAKVWGCPGLPDREAGVRWTGEIPHGARPPGFFANNDDATTTATTTTKTTMTEEGGGSSAAAAAGGMWDWNELMPYHVDFEANPFTGRSFFNEVVFYHRPSKTLLTTDFYWNYPGGDGVTNGQLVDDDDGVVGATDVDDDEDFGPWDLAPSVGTIPLGSRLWGKVGMDRLFYPFYVNLMVGGDDNRDAFGDMARHVACGGRCGGDDGDYATITGGWDVETIIPCHGDIVRGRQLCRRVLEKHFGVKCQASSK